LELLGKITKHFEDAETQAQNIFFGIDQSSGTEKPKEDDADKNSAKKQFLLPNLLLWKEEIEERIL